MTVIVIQFRVVAGAPKSRSSGAPPLHARMQHSHLVKG
jgi:hypothetical protein